MSLKKCVLLFIMSLCSFNSQAEQTALIAAASSTQFALEQLKKVFHQQTGVTIHISYGSSGSITRQLIQGAPFQLFLSADEYYINQLKPHHLLVDAGVIYASGRLALFLPTDSPIKADINLKNLLNHPTIKRFSIANPQHAPYGKAAKQILINTGNWDSIKTKLVLGENAAQAAQHASSGMTQGGLIAYSYALLPTIKQRGTSLLLPQSLHQPFYARMVLIKTANHITKRFYQFLQTQTAKAIFQQHGF